MEPVSLTRPHLEDGELLCLLDGEAEAVARGDAEAHLEACAACRGRMERFRTRRERLASLLASADFSPPVPMTPPSTVLLSEAGPTAGEAATARAGAKVIPLRGRPAPAGRRVDRPWLRAAAAVLLLAAAVAVATPARAWIAQWVGRQWSQLAHGGRSAPAPPPAAPAPAPPAAPQASAQVRFVPAGSELRVEVAHAQRAGTLTLVPVAGTAALAEVLGAQGVELLVVPSGLRIRNAANDAAGYRIQVPEGVRRVRVRVGAGRESVIERTSIGPAGVGLALGS